MQPNVTPRCARRTVLRTLGTSLAAASVAGITTAQSDSASIAFVDQESDGQSVIIKSLEMPVNGELLLMAGDNDYRDLQLDAGTSFTERRIELSQPLEESTLVRAQLQSETDYLTDEQALVAVNESLERARSSFSVPSGKVEIVDPDPDAGFQLPYGLYTPDTVIDGAPIFVEPLWEATPVATRAELRDQLRSDIAGGSIERVFELNVPVLVPGLPHLPLPGNDELLAIEIPRLNSPGVLEEIATEDFPPESLRRVDRQMVQMIQDGKRRLAGAGYSVAPTIHMTGFSASAQFCSRFAFLHPSLVNTITIGGSGAFPLPKSSHNGVELPYPLGTADYEALTGREFDRDRWSEITQYIYVGREDQPTIDEEGHYSISDVYEDRAFDVFGLNRVTERIPTTRAAYEAAGADATFRIYDGAGHEITDEMAEDTLNIHRDTLNTADDWSIPETLLVDIPDRTPTPTATPTPTQTSALTPTPTAIETGAVGTREPATTGDSGPGFGLPAMVTSLVAVGYLLARRVQQGNEG